MHTNPHQLLETPHRAVFEENTGNRTLEEMRTRLRRMKTNTVRRKIDAIGQKYQSTRPEPAPEPEPKPEEDLPVDSPMQPAGFVKKKAVRIIYLKPIGPGRVFINGNKDLIEIVASKHNVNPKEILSETRVRPVVRARSELAYVLKMEKGLSLPLVAKYCGQKDHTSALHAIRIHCDRNKLPLPKGVGLPTGNHKKRYSDEFCRGDYQK